VHKLIVPWYIKTIHRNTTNNRPDVFYISCNVIVLAYFNTVFKA